MPSPVLLVKSNPPDVDLEIVGNDSSWNRINFDDTNVQDEHTLMHQLEPSERDHVVKTNMQTELQTRLDTWASGRPYECGACGIRLQGWMKGKRDMFIACWPWNIVEGVEFATVANHEAPSQVLLTNIPWEKKYYVILDNEFQFFGHRRKCNMHYYMFRAWITEAQTEEAHAVEGIQIGVAEIERE
ncbi:hypothetical protein BX600DRAFT_470101 [Xylariales sp. PMI_506]|nr:hypothetical protein BX600DRAFT_470101 [Xylariales sp. PMI_506]